MYVLVSVLRDAMMIVDDFKAIVSELVAEDELPDAGPRVELTDAVIARLYSTSKQAIVSCCIVQHCCTTLCCLLKNFPFSIAFTYEILCHALPLIYHVLLNNLHTVNSSR